MSCQMPHFLILLASLPLLPQDALPPKCSASGSEKIIHQLAVPAQVGLPNDVNHHDTDWFYQVWLTWCDQHTWYTLPSIVGVSGVTGINYSIPGMPGVSGIPGITDVPGMTFVPVIPRLC